jgi:gamma-glutamylputrescine oxidase
MPTTPAWGTPPWRVDLDIAPAAPPARCDVAVVGGGFTGLSAAYHLAQRGVRVALLEASRLGSGASGRTGGIVLEGTAIGLMERVEHCLDALAAVVARERIACELRLGGCWELTHRRDPDSRGRLWRDGDAWLYVSDTVPGGTVDPGALVSGLGRAARDAGASLHEDARVLGIEPGRPTCLRLAHGTVEADHVVVALNGYTAALLTLPIRLGAALTLALATDPIGEPGLAELGLGDGMPFYTTDLPYLWGRITADGRLVLGAGLLHGDDVSRVALHDADGTATLDRLEERVARMHPVLARTRIVARWGGPIAFTPQRTPVLSRLPSTSASDVIVYAGCAGHGIALGVRVGQLVTESIVDGVPLPSWGALPGAPQK